MVTITQVQDVVEVEESEMEEEESEEELNEDMERFEKLVYDDKAVWK
jgi:hypothetical protein